MTLLARLGPMSVRTGTVLSVAGLAHSLVNARLLRRPGPAPTDLPATAILVPARNEASTIAACIESIGPDAVVLDDDSMDGTGAIARDAGARVLAGAPVPPGWLGKPWACEQLSRTPEAEAADVLVFVDADVRLEPDAVGRAVGLLVSAGLDVVCPFPRQLAFGPSERLVQPLLQWSWIATLPLRLAEHSQRPTLTAACGQFLVIRRSALEAAGGFAGVRGEVLDDLALVRAVKASGGRGGVVDGTDLAQCRMYDGGKQVWAGYGKSLWSAFGSPASAGATLALLGVAYVVPPLAALRGSRVGALGYAAAVGSRIVSARRTGGRSAPDAFAHPVSVVMLAVLAIDSLRQRRRGTLLWKGRLVAWD